MESYIEQDLEVEALKEGFFDSPILKHHRSKFPSAFVVPTIEDVHNGIQRDYKTPLELMNEGKFLKCAAPMVRYSKLGFRMLCQRWGCDLTYTPMIVAKDFNASQFARDSEFTTNKYDRPLIVQFAASNAKDFADAASKVTKFCDGIDLNCGCPQKWVMAEGYGSALLQNPELIRDMVKSAQESSKLPISIKIRIDTDMKKTIELAQKAQAIGCSWITVHGRTPKMRSTVPADFESIKLVKEHMEIPVLANGDVFNLKDTYEIKNKTGVNGVMAARGLLNNPALFAGYDYCPLECVKDWLDISLRLGNSFFLVHQHLMFMLFSIHNRLEKLEFNQLNSMSGIFDFLETRGIHFHSTIK